MPLKLALRFSLLLAALLLSNSQALATDTDSDGVVDEQDNCSTDANDTQLDTNLDGYGNLCDSDYNDDGATGVPDFNIFRNALGAIYPAVVGPLPDPLILEVTMHSNSPTSGRLPNRPPVGVVSKR